MGGRIDQIFYIETNWFNYDQYIKRIIEITKNIRKKNAPKFNIRLIRKIEQIYNGK